MRSNQRLQKARVPLEQTKNKILKLVSQTKKLHQKVSKLESFICFWNLNWCALKLDGSLTVRVIRTEMLVDSIEQSLAALKTQRDKPGVEILHIMRTIQIVVNKALSSRAEGLDSIEFIFFHSNGFPALHQWNCLPCMNSVRCDRMPVQISYRLYLQPRKLTLNWNVHFVFLYCKTNMHLLHENIRWTVYLMSFTIDLNFIGLHNFLNGSSDVAQRYIDTCSPNAGVCGVAYSLNQFVVFGIERQCERAIDNATVDVGSEINFGYIVVLQHRGVTCIGRIMSCAVISRASGRKSQSGFQTILAD